MRRSLVSEKNESGGGSSLGIVEIAYHQPDWSLPNDWYQPSMPRKFAQHTGIHSRSIAEVDEVELAECAAKKLFREVSCDPFDCAGVVFACPSLIPQQVAHQYADSNRAKQEQPNRVARKLVDRLGIHPRKVVGINSYCSGYARALSILLTKMNSVTELKPNEYVLVLTSSRISRITDYSCQQTGALFGDMATATLIARCDSPKYAVQFEIVDAYYRKQPTTKPYFNFALRLGVLKPKRLGQREYDASRIVFSLDGMGIGETAPRAMASAAAAILENNQLSPSDIQYVVPHQAGTGIVRFTQLKLEELGVSAEVINGMTSDIGNVSSNSVPYTLKRTWNTLYGNILCPVAAVGAPGKKEVSHGCVLLRRLSRIVSQAA